MKMNAKIKNKDKNKNKNKDKLTPTSSIAATGIDCGVGTTG